jgi:2,3-bisphosphoglycerate-independent phosphoglycerate mutase
MSAPEATEAFLRHWQADEPVFAIINYANADMVGHTGNFEAAKRAIETLDACIGRVVDAARAHGADVVITSDHGNAERMHDETTGQAHTAHTRNLVPLVYVGRPARIAEGGALQDVAPTLLAVMGLPKPPQMTGHSLLRF